MKKEKAFELALDFISNSFDLSDNGDEVIINDAKSKQINSGWLIAYNSKLFIETGDFNKMLMGNKPVFVGANGVIKFISISEFMDEKVNRNQ